MRHGFISRRRQGVVSGNESDADRYRHGSVLMTVKRTLNDTEF